MKTPVQTVLGHRIPETRLTARAIVLLVAGIGLPVLVVGTLLDLLVQWLFGWCVGLWCLAG
jgi:hypothetical protein